MVTQKTFKKKKKKKDNNKSGFSLLLHILIVSKQQNKIEILETFFLAKDSKISVLERKKMSY